MNVGSKIKEYRMKKGLTQKDLADELHVTYQAVSKWENDSAEPSFDMLKQMCDIFECTIDDLFGTKKDTADIVEEKIVYGICDQCGKHIIKEDEVFRIEETKKGVKDNKEYIETTTKTLCKECNEIWQLTEGKKIEKAEKEKKDNIKSKRIASFVIPSAVFILFIIVAISEFVAGNAGDGCYAIALAVLGFTFAGTLILNNTFLPDLWLTIASWGFVKMPGVIFSLDLGGLIFLVVVKVLLFLLSLIFVLFAMFCATIIALVVSIFVYPYALYKNLKGIE